MSDRQQMRTYFSAEQATQIERYAIDHDQTYAQAVRDLVDRGLGMEAAQASAPWLESLLDAVMAKYFRDFPEVLNRLVVSTFEQTSWGMSLLVKLLELVGEKDHDRQDARVKKTVDQIADYARRKADEFFQEVSTPEELIEPDEPTEYSQ